ncbi:MAG: glycosyltransferase [Thermoflavifilum sp.]|nr:glycosyltransferase [Thermoflavifilum sp.]
MCARKHALWLVSWYPDRLQPINGDFIERHAYAASRVVNVIVLHITKDPQIKAIQLETDYSRAPHLVVYRWYYPPSRFRISWLQKLHHVWKYVRTAFRAYRLIQKKHPSIDYIHVHVCWKAGLLALCLKRLFGNPYWISEHASYFQPASPASYWRDHGLKCWLIRLILRQASLWLPVSADLGNRLRMVAGDKPIYVLPNAVDITLFTYQQKTRQREIRRFIHVSDMQPHKRPEAVIAAFERIARQLPEWELQLVGPWRGELEKKILGSPYADRMCITGWLFPAEVALHLQDADVFVMCSDYENQPCALLEALCCGLPVIATRVGGIPEIVHEGNGKLIPPGDELALANAMLEVARQLPYFDRHIIACEAQACFGYPAITEHFKQVYDCPGN